MRLFGPRVAIKRPAAGADPRDETLERSACAHAAAAAEAQAAVARLMADARDDDERRSQAARARLAGLFPRPAGHGD